MTAKQREIIFKINEAVKKALTPPPTTNTALTGQINTPQVPQPTVYNLPTLTQTKPQG